MSLRFNLGLIILSTVLWADFSGTIAALSEIKKQIADNVMFGPRVVYVFFYGIGIFLPFAVALAKYVSFNVFLITSASVYAVFSIVFGVWDNASFNLLCRFFQGAGSAALLFGVFYTLAKTRPFPSRSYQVYALLGIIFGPLLSLICVSFFSWPLFYTTLGLLTLIGAAFVVLESKIDSLKLNIVDNALKPALTLMVCFTSAILFINLLMNSHYGVFSTTIGLIVLVCSTLLYIRMEEGGVNALFFSNDLREHGPLLLYIIGFFTGFITIPLLLIQISFFKIVYLTNPVVATSMMLLSMSMISLSAVFGYQLCRKYSRLGTVLLALFVLLFSFGLNTQLHFNSSQMFIVFSIVIAGCGMGLLLSSGLGNKLEKYKRAVSLRLGLNFFLLLSIGACIGSVVFSHIIVKTLIDKASFHINAGMLLLPKNMANQADLIPYIVNNYSHLSQATNTFFSQREAKVLYDIYCQSFSYSLYVFFSMAFIITSIVIYFVFKKLRAQSL